MPEYSLMVALIAVVLIAGVSALSQSLKASYGKVTDHVVAALNDHDAAAAP
jgi:Flp pilus assembly pilin Flp